EILEARLAPANWMGTLTSDTTWSNSEVQHIVGSVTVAQGVTLTVQAGTIVQFNFGTSLTVDGTLLAHGTAAQTIVFTSGSDNSATGGSNNASPGNWGSITFDSNSSGSMLMDTAVAYGGGFGAVGAVVDNGGPVTLASSVVENSGTTGLRITQANPT